MAQAPGVTTASINYTCAAHKPHFVLMFQRLGRFGFELIWHPNVAQAFLVVCAQISGLGCSSLPKHGAMYFGSC